MKVVKLEGNIKVINSEVDKQPTIFVGLGGNVKVTLDDGRVFEDNDLLWEDAPQFKNDNLTEEETDEINEHIEEKLFEVAQKIADKIKELNVNISGE